VIIGYAENATLYRAMTTDTDQMPTVPRILHEATRSSYLEEFLDSGIRRGVTIWRNQSVQTQPFAIGVISHSGQMIRRNLQTTINIKRLLHVTYTKVYMGSGYAARSAQSFFSQH
jgi:hypothetical protein